MAAWCVVVREEKTWLPEVCDAKSRVDMQDKMKTEDRLKCGRLWMCLTQKK